MSTVQLDNRLHMVGTQADRLLGLDRIVIGLWCAVLVIGITGVGSASMEMSVTQYHYAFGYLLRHVVYVSAGVTAALVALIVPLQFWLKYGRLAFLIGLLLLAVVLFGRPVNGARRWLELHFFTVQPSEIMKVLYIVFLARHLSLVGERILELRALLGVLALLLLTCCLMVLEPDFGSAVVLSATTFGVLFLARAKLTHLGSFGVIALLAAGALILFQPYRLARVFAFTNPWAEQYGSGYQLTQALIAFGRGSWLGTGIGDSIQKLFYLPEAHNDFLFAVIAEETGLFGATVVIALLLGLALRLLYVGRKADEQGQQFGAYLAYGVGVLIAVQTFINVGVNTGLLPTKGLTLPFISYGGNSLIVSGALIGLVLRVHWETVHPPKGQLSVGHTRHKQPPQGRSRGN